ncbi:MAG: hypothetical protein K2N84_02170, partial [Clostridia bacterium]|nr:hypothetical protein [Clostridia bacterium]
MENETKNEFEFEETAETQAEATTQQAAAKTLDHPMKMKIPTSRRVFLIINTTLLCLLALLCLVPFLNLLATSLSSKEAVDAGQVGLFPVGFTANAYQV